MLWRHWFSVLLDISFKRHFTISTTIGPNRLQTPAFNPPSLLLNETRFSASRTPSMPRAMPLFRLFSPSLLRKFSRGPGAQATHRTDSLPNSLLEIARTFHQHTDLFESTCTRWDPNQREGGSTHPHLTKTHTSPNQSISTILTQKKTRQ